jgi:hypothetical protein
MYKFIEKDKYNQLIKKYKLTTIKDGILISDKMKKDVFIIISAQ